MATKRSNTKGIRSAAAGRVGTLRSAVSTGQQFFNGAAGRWATAQLKALALEGKALSTSALRAADTLRHEEWKFFDEALLEEAKIRLVGVADLMGRGLVKPVTNALGKTVFAYEKLTDMDPATVSLDGISRSHNDRQEFELAQLPLPIIHKDFFINLRVLAASRERGESLDTTQVRTAGRVVAEAMEDMLFNGSKTFGGLPIYGYLTHPDRNDGTFIANGDWAQSAKTGENILADALKAISALHTDRMFGPYIIYVPTDAGVKLENDFKANSDKTIRQRLEEIDSIAAVRVADTMPSGKVLVVQMTSDVTSWVNGENIQSIQWDEYGGFEINFKAFAIGAPLVRSDAQSRSGVYELHS
jgi:uncharacterized linocin/CFP29 family protein